MYRMIRAILKGYVKLLRSLLRYTVIALACLLCAAAIVWPLWLLASTRPRLYTILCGILCLVITVSLIITRVKPLASARPRQYVLSALRKLLVIGGISGSVTLVLHYQRLAALLVLCVTAIIYGYLAFALPQVRTDHRQ